MALSPEEEAEYHALLEAQYDVEPLGDFIGRISPKWPSPSHVAPLRRLIERSRTEEVNALISFPPRFVKTITIQHAIAWLLANAPASQHAYVTSAQRLAQSKSRTMQRLTLSAGVELASRSVDEWTTAAGGGLLATSIGGQYVGMGTTGLQIVDDPYSGPEAAESPVQREAVWDWYQGVAHNRVEPGGSRVINHTRWHPDDLIGRLLKEEGRVGEGGRWEEINVPAVLGFSEEGLELHRAGKADISAIGRAVWPEYWPLERLLAAMKYKHFWWALYMGSPRVRGMKLFNEPARFDLSEFSWHGRRGCIAIDPAATKKTRADHSAIAVMAMEGRGDDTESWVVDMKRGQWSIPELVRRARDVQLRYGLVIVVEAVGGFKSVPQMLHDVDPSLRIVEVSPSQDKFLRAQPVSAAWNDGRVYVPTLAPWVDEYLSEMGAFTGVADAEDDQVDSTAHGFNALYQAGVEPERGERLGIELPFG
jgi:predicted phage terminase large subunit-like protein